jgi:hypothetical protein
LMRGVRAISPPCSFGLSTTISLRTNQSSAISQQYFSLKTNQHQSPATNQTNRQVHPVQFAQRAAFGYNEREQLACIGIYNWLIMNLAIYIAAGELFTLQPNCTKVNRMHDLTKFFWLRAAPEFHYRSNEITVMTVKKQRRNSLNDNENRNRVARTREDEHTGLSFPHKLPAKQRQTEF